MQYPMSVPNEIVLSVVSYSISYYDATSNILCGSVVIQHSSMNYCVNKTCRHVFDISLSPCHSSSNFSITALATNVFGDGPVSNYTVSVYDSEANINITRYIDVDGVYVSSESPIIWIASLGSLLLLALIVCSVLVVVIVLMCVGTKIRISRESLNQQIQMVHANNEESDLNQPVPSSTIPTEENIAYANVLIN